MRLVITPHSDRSEEGLLRPVVEAAKAHPELRLQAEKFLSPKLDRDLGDLYWEFYKKFETQKPDLVLISFDRREMVFIALAAHTLGIPIVHMHAGDLGSEHPDEVHRGLVSRLAALMLTNGPRSRKNLIAMGEEPWRVVDVGSTALDGIKLRDSKIVAREYGYDGNAYEIVVYHPDPSSVENTIAELEQITDAVCAQDACDVIWLSPNPDRNREYVERIRANLDRDDGYIIMDSFKSRDDYLSALVGAKLLIGNSSSFALEAPFVTKAKVVWIGNRNRNRERPDKLRIGASKRIVEMLASVDLEKLKKPKKFEVG